ncbi:hypothetical protein BU24DRAFT_411149 [Aaosphaeria arxii CBS 175.79]|uniref:Extracellular membrane protein CFEM domain-containing protein n=1 Tax=Aaosphaeria arxii CBS 175.79 TaxID=1450172 RepID=A0A6A5XL03_9PLEO|nr:uncharacterized protein BU24DRAFT_411149 [Aaosphaeria arxii CBS 175.79]KAF2013410.1 hypothetical protein BU24DRAFT_411149 [Aaosphaeria arxii CBS 175.79]
MKYAAIVLALAAGAFAFPQEASASVTAAPSVVSASLRPEVSCALACDPKDVTCQAACLGVARPNSSQANANNECARKCDQGDGSKSATEEFAKCLAACAAQYFPSTQTAVVKFHPNCFVLEAWWLLERPIEANAWETGAANSNAPSGTGAQASGSPSGTAAGTTQSPGAASANGVKIAGAGLAGLAMALFAL